MTSMGNNELAAWRCDRRTWSSIVRCFALFRVALAAGVTVGLAVLAVATSSAVAAEGGAAALPPFKPRVALRRAMPAITNPPLMAASKVGDRLGDAELVLGVTLDGKARAYPINMLTGPRREIINDSLGGRPIAATW